MWGNLYLVYWSCQANQLGMEFFYILPDLRDRISLRIYGDEDRLHWISFLLLYAKMLVICQSKQICTMLYHSDLVVSDSAGDRDLQPF